MNARFPIFQCYMRRAFKAYLAIFIPNESPFGTLGKSELEKSASVGTGFLSVQIIIVQQFGGGFLTFFG